MTDNFKADKAAFEAATPGEWRTAYHGQWEVETYPNQLLAQCGTINSARENAALIVRMHATYLARMARIEQLIDELIRAQRLLHEHKSDAATLNHILKASK